jgi:hypothetical protein
MAGFPGRVGRRDLTFVKIWTKYRVTQRGLPLKTMRFFIRNPFVALTHLFLSLPFHLDAVKLFLLVHSSTTT